MMQDDWEKLKERALIILTSLYCIIMAAGMYYNIKDDNSNDMLNQKPRYLPLTRY
jgi:hypothetical protein